MNRLAHWRLDTKDGAGSHLGVHRTSLATNIVCLAFYLVLGFLLGVLLSSANDLAA